MWATFGLYFGSPKTKSLWEAKVAQLSFGRIYMDMSRQGFWGIKDFVYVVVFLECVVGLPIRWMPLSGELF